MSGFSPRLTPGCPVPSIGAQSSSAGRARKQPCNEQEKWEDRMRGICRLSLLAAGAVFAWGLSGPLVPQAEAADLTIKLGWASSGGETDPYAIGARAFKQAVEAELKGRIEVQLFPNRALGDEKPLLEGMRLGTVEAGDHHQRGGRADRAGLPDQRHAVPLFRRGAGAEDPGRPGRRQAAQEAGNEGCRPARLHGGRLPRHDQQCPAGVDSRRT